METETKNTIIKTVCRAMDAYVEENKTIYEPVELQSSTAEVTMFVYGFLPRYLQDL